MASQATAAKQTGATPGKLALIGVLAVVLVVVLYIQFGGTIANPPANTVHSAGSAESSASREQSAATTETATTVVDKPRKTGELGQWLSPDLAAAVQYDPFALPASFPQPSAENDAAAMAQVAAQSIEDASAQQAALDAERAQSQTELAGLRQQGVQVIIKKKNEYVAIIGDEEVHVGDQISGFTVIAIDADGVRLAKDLSP